MRQEYGCSICLVASTVSSISANRLTAGGTLDRVYTRSGEAVVYAGVEPAGSLYDHSFIT